MRVDPIVNDSWALVTPDAADIDELMHWLPDARSVDRWGGPRFRYPFTPETFRDDCRIDDILSFCLRRPDGAMAAFGQVYDRHDRAHLARLITHPKMRGQGIGKRLVATLVGAAQQLCGHAECSLFVYRDNEPAYRCYLSSGFELQKYPPDAPMKDECYFMTRAVD
ncbi:MAG: GNAT family N-acetyltransferase [Gammaproteobacteria bacterium]|nr:GNAT family N-acetyltransferase [Gammaproteobacteria bacterium]NNC57483.1 GNAT family N-acetyltransferase [Woeseiaceae bacterium]NNL51803.1 GNAT family N-acetyltransferase [Woeseiaceae bacterium]